MTIDLRSDTVTRPTPAMRKAMAEAEVGDDVYGEDPTVNRLQSRVAELLGTEAALFVPSGTMANQIAIGILTRPGEEIIAGAGAHNWLFETGAAAALNGVSHCIVPGDGRFDAAAVRAHYKPDNHNVAATRVVSVENTHNLGGGVLWEPQAVTEVVEAARELGLSTHLDGARLWNAAIAQGCAEHELCRGFDTVSVCLSKGLGAPVGSLVAGSAARMRDAHRLRKRFGGGMRQAGILAAAGLHALDHHRDRLVDDHRRARTLAERLARGPAALRVDLDRVHTNIVMVDLAGELDAQAWVDRCQSAGVLFYAMGPRRARLVTHLDVSDAHIERAAEILCENAA